MNAENGKKYLKIKSFKFKWHEHKIGLIIIAKIM
jgi:hypothetical protein